MKQVSTLLPKVVVYTAGLAAVILCVVLFPELAREEMAGKPQSADVTLPFLAVAYILATPFFVALYQSHKFLRLVDTRNVFSNEAISTLQNIKTCALVFIVFALTTFVGGGFLLRISNPQEDAPPFFMMGFILTFVSVVIIISIAVLQKILTDAVLHKSENDLIV